MNRQHYLFSPLPSKHACYWRWFGLSLLFLSLFTWPAALPTWSVFLQWAIVVGLLYQAYDMRFPLPARAFLLDERGQGRWLDNGHSFKVLRYSRLLPRLVILVIDHEDKKECHLLYEDAFSNLDWRRLCRLVLQQQKA